MTPQQAATALRRKARAIRPALAAAEAETIKDALQLALVYSNGPFSNSDLSRMGHPYATRHGRALLDPSVINRHTGTFIDGWVLSSGGWTGDVLAQRLSNATKVAEFLNSGTRFMVERPIIQRIVIEITPRRYARLHAALRQALAA